MSPGAPRRWRACALTLAWALVPAAGTAAAQGDERAVLEQSVRRGPVDVVVRLAPAEPRIGDTLTLEIEARAPEGVELGMPEFGEALDRFAILDFAPRERATPDGVVATQRYSLEVPYSGEHSIPPLLVEFVDRRPGQTPAPDDADAWELLTGRLDFEVRSVLPADARPELTPPPEPLALERGARRAAWLWVVLGLALVVAGAALWAVVSRRRARVRRASAWQVARAALDALRARGQPEPEQMAAFYTELTDIVRRYLEQRFELRSPELTTEEFLEVAARSPDLDAELRQLLGGFLTSADLVKFARKVPEHDEVEAEIAAAERFLDRTRDRDAPEPARA